MLVFAHHPAGAAALGRHGDVSPDELLQLLHALPLHYAERLPLAPPSRTGGAAVGVAGARPGAAVPTPAAAPLSPEAHALALLTADERDTDGVLFVPGFAVLPPTITASATAAGQAAGFPAAARMVTGPSPVTGSALPPSPGVTYAGTGIPRPAATAAMAAAERERAEHGAITAYLAQPQGQGKSQQQYQLWLPVRAGVDGQGLQQYAPRQLVGQQYNGPPQTYATLQQQQPQYSQGQQYSVPPEQYSQGQQYPQVVAASMGLGQQPPAAAPLPVASLPQQAQMQPAAYAQQPYPPSGMAAMQQPQYQQQYSQLQPHLPPLYTGQPPPPHQDLFRSASSGQYPVIHSPRSAQQQQRQYGLAAESGAHAGGRQPSPGRSDSPVRGAEGAQPHSATGRLVVRPGEGSGRQQYSQQHGLAREEQYGLADEARRALPPAIKSGVGEPPRPDSPGGGGGRPLQRAPSALAAPSGSGGGAAGGESLQGLGGGSGYGLEADTSRAETGLGERRVPDVGPQRAVSPSPVRPGGGGAGGEGGYGLDHENGGRDVGVGAADSRVEYGGRAPSPAPIRAHTAAAGLREEVPAARQPSPGSSQLYGSSPPRPSTISSSLAPAAAPGAPRPALKGALKGSPDVSRDGDSNAYGLGAEAAPGSGPAAADRPALATHGTNRSVATSALANRTGSGGYGLGAESSAAPPRSASPAASPASRPPAGTNITNSSGLGSRPDSSLPASSSGAGVRGSSGGRGMPPHKPGDSHGLGLDEDDLEGDIEF